MIIPIVIMIILKRNDNDYDIDNVIIIRFSNSLLLYLVVENWRREITMVNVCSFMNGLMGLN